MRSIVIILLITCACTSQAQVNYIMNGGLEHYSQCPSWPDQIRYCNYWRSIDTTTETPLCSAEYCNACAGNNIYVGVPLTGYYNQRPRSGNGMMQVNMYFDNGYHPESYQRDYMQGRLSTNLIAGENYCVTFYVNLEEESQYAIDHIGAYLDNGSIDVGQDSTGCASPQTTYTPQIYSTTIINDTLNWVKIQGSFIAAGTERFITIGNFSDISHTDTLKVSPRTANNFGYYLIDDVSVIKSDAIANAGPDVIIAPGDSAFIGTSDEGMPETWYIYAGEDTTRIGYSGGIWVQPSATTTYIVEMDLCGHVTYDTMTVFVWPLGVTSPRPSPEERVLLYPNPTMGSVVIEHAKGAEVTISDVMGRSVGLTMTIKSEKETINIESLHEGVYVVQIVDPSSGYKVTKKIIKE